MAPDAEQEAGQTEPPLASRPTCELKSDCSACGKAFGLTCKRRHCKNCGRSLCTKHLTKQVVLYHLGYVTPQDTCSTCFEALVSAASSTTQGTPQSAGVWRQDSRCGICNVHFHVFRPRHHCRNCGASICHTHSSHRMALYHKGIEKPQRTCDTCRASLLTASRMASLTPRGDSPHPRPPASSPQPQEPPLAVPSAPPAIAVEALSVSAIPIAEEVRMAVVTLPGAEGGCS